MSLEVRLIERADKPEETRIIAVNQPQFLIGRGTDCDLRLLGTDISRHHCLIRLSADEVVLMDLGSQNGSYLNGQRVISQAELKSGDIVQVGTCQFEIDLGDGNAEMLRETTRSLSSTVIRKQFPKNELPEPNE
jgi:pSer/pThr/pTyr-binding forkhead associated (FHA) protein